MRVRATRELAAHCHEAHTLPQPWSALGLPCGGPGAALAGALWRAGLLGDGPASCWAFVWQASSDANSYDTLPINFPIPEFISDTNNI